MDRRDLVQAFIDYRRARTYLEIGVKKGKLFLPIRARRKIAVDPILLIPFKRKWKAILKYPANLFNQYYETTSDRFFETKGAYLKDIDGVDVVFIDGLHTYRQTWIDVCNALNYLRPNGVILMHDCSPASSEQATPAQSRGHAEETKAVQRGRPWSGDVWKTIVRLRSERSDLIVSVLDCDSGVGVIMPGSPKETLNFTAEAIDRMAYEDLERNRSKFLNLHEPDMLSTML